MHDRPAFELEVFTWGAPDRLDVAGTFVGASGVPTDAPVLVVHGEGAPHRLPVASGPSGTCEDGQQWSATFVWQTAPMPFDAARLELGDDFVVELPQPGGTGAEDDRV